MKEKLIRDRQVEHGHALFTAPKQLIEFTGVAEADTLLNNLTEYPYAFVLACVMDRQIRAEKAWLIPFNISEKLNGFFMKKLCHLSRADLNRLMTEPVPLPICTPMATVTFLSRSERHILTFLLLKVMSC